MFLELKAHISDIPTETWARCGEYGLLRTVTKFAVQTNVYRQTSKASFRASCECQMISFSKLILLVKLQVM